MPPLGSSHDVRRQPGVNPGYDADIPVERGADVGRAPDARDVDRMEGGRRGGHEAPASARRTIGQRLGALTRGLLKGAAVLGLAAGLIVGGHYAVTEIAPQYLNQIEVPTVPGTVNDPSLPGGQGPPVEVDPGPGIHRSPTLPTDGVDVDGPGGGPGGLPTPPVTLPQFDPAEVKPDLIPGHGGQTPADALKPQVIQPGGVQSPVHGIPGLSGQGGGADVQIDVEPTKPPLSEQPQPDLRPADGTGATTDPLKATLRNDGTVVQPQIDTTRLPTFKPHMLRGQ